MASTTSIRSSFDRDNAPKGEASPFRTAGTTEPPMDALVPLAWTCTGEVSFGEAERQGDSAGVSCAAPAGPNPDADGLVAV